MKSLEQLIISGVASRVEGDMMESIKMHFINSRDSVSARAKDGKLYTDAIVEFIMFLIEKKNIVIDDLGCAFDFTWTTEPGGFAIGKVVSISVNINGLFIMIDVTDNSYIISAAVAGISDDGIARGSIIASTEKFAMPRLEDAGPKDALGLFKFYTFTESSRVWQKI